MSESESYSEGISHNIEHPILKRTLEFNIDDYFSTDVSKRRDWFYGQLLGKIPEGELKDALELAVKESDARKKESQQGITVNRWNNPIIKEAEKYAFRSFIRRSDGLPTTEHPDSVYSTVQDSIHTSGIDNPSESSPTMIMPSTIWDQFLLPTEISFHDMHEDISTILVYKNEPFVVSTNTEQGATKLVDVNEPLILKRTKEISIEDAKQKKYPTLRDNLVGQVEVRWISSNN